MLRKVDTVLKKLFIITSLCFYTNCRTLYSGKDSIDSTKILYPETVYNKKKSFNFQPKVNKGDVSQTIFLNIIIQNPNKYDDRIQNFYNQTSGKLSKKLKELASKTAKRNVVNFNVDFTDVKKIKEVKLKENIELIKSKIIEKKQEKEFSAIVVNVIHNGSMNACAQYIIRGLKNQDIQDPECSYVNEICFNPFEKKLNNEEIENTKIFVNENWKNTNRKNICNIGNENLLEHLSLYLIKKDQKFEPLKNKNKKEDFITELKKYNDEDCKQILQFLEQDSDKYACYFNYDNSELQIVDMDKVVEMVIDDCFIE